MNEQGSIGWLLDRAGTLSASLFGAALGLAPYCSRQKLWRQLTGLETRDVFGPAVDWGRDHEPDAVLRYEIEAGVIVASVGSVPHPEHAWLSASPDGLVGDIGGIEAKCPFLVDGKTWPERMHETPPQHYLAQVHGVIQCCGLEWVDYLCWTPIRFRAWRVMRDEEIWGEIIFPKLKAFWDAVQTKADPGRMKKADKVIIPYSSAPWIDVEYEEVINPDPCAGTPFSDEALAAKEAKWQD